MAQRKLNLNSLGRYGKQSDNLILEAHGSCEVPAGCGGVVLRWRNPNTGLIFLIRVFCQHKYEFFIDGVKPASGRPVIPFGNHVLALTIDDVDVTTIAIGVAMVHDEEQFGFPHVSQLSGRKISILTAADGSWKYSTAGPASDDWQRPGFDDSGWSAMTYRDPPPIGDKEGGRYQLQKVLESGAQCLGADGSGKRLLIRREFSRDPLK
jgi:hypothetical protein